MSLQTRSLLGYKPDWAGDVELRWALEEAGPAHSLIHEDRRPRHARLFATKRLAELHAGPHEYAVPVKVTIEGWGRYSFQEVPKHV